MPRAASSKSKTEQRKMENPEIAVCDAKTKEPICCLRGRVKKSTGPKHCEKCGGLLNYDDVTPKLPEWGVEQVGCSCD